MNTNKLDLRRACRVLLIGGVIAITGCAQAPKPLYQWDTYQDKLYQHFRDESSDPADQLKELEAQATKSAAAGTKLPPGFRAHIGLLHIRLGSDEPARLAFEAEKREFPEAAPYMDFLLQRMSKSAASQ